jgi:hypothetical protein
VVFVVATRAPDVGLAAAQDDRPGPDAERRLACVAPVGRHLAGRRGQGRSRHAELVFSRPLVGVCLCRVCRRVRGGRTRGWRIRGGRDRSRGRRDGLGRLKRRQGAPICAIGEGRGLRAGGHQGALVGSDQVGQPVLLVERIKRGSAWQSKRELPDGMAEGACAWASLRGLEQPGRPAVVQETTPQPGLVCQRGERGRCGFGGWPGWSGQGAGEASVKGWRALGLPCWWDPGAGPRRGRPWPWRGRPSSNTPWRARGWPVMPSRP